jgi:hemerythrin
MNKIIKIKVETGVDWVEIPEADLRIQCGCPADSTKHLIAKGLIKSYNMEDQSFESGPNALLLSDVAIQNGQFCNLGEFPVLQMLYRQGMIIPNHSNNKGEFPILIGKYNQVDAQLNYIYRGNYGLTSMEELKEAGCSEELATKIYRMKKKFAFGKFIPSNELFDIKLLDSKKLEIKKGVFITRENTNKFLISYKDEEVRIDLNIKSIESYRPPYSLGHRNIKRAHFSIIHSGDGDGWDIHQPCMGSIICYNSDIYLVDAAPNIISTLSALGISISEIKGIFHTHSHDDHFNGLTALIKADHKLQYYSTSFVRFSVSKKLSALMSNKEDMLEKYFITNDLKLNEWNNIGGLEVKPLLSPHPVENVNFIFRLIADGAHKTYYHMADTTSFATMETMENENDLEPGMSQNFIEQVKNNYRIGANVKKVDIGGGLIHGNAIDFKNDSSDKVILSHTADVLTKEEKLIGSRASFGLEEILIESNSNQILRYAKKHLTSYFEGITTESLDDMLNCPIVLFNAGSVILKSGQSTNYLYLSLTGNVEIISESEDIHHVLSAGTFIGEMSGLLDEQRNRTYIASSYVWALKIPTNMYKDFVCRHQLMDEILASRTYRNYFTKSKVFKSISSSAVIHNLSKNIILKHTKKDDPFNARLGDHIVFLIVGEMKLMHDGVAIETIRPGDICGEAGILENSDVDSYDVIVTKDSEYGVIDGHLLRSIPSIMWNILEIHERRRVK